MGPCRALTPPPPAALSGHGGRGAGGGAVEAGQGGGGQGASGEARGGPGRGGCRGEAGAGPGPRCSPDAVPVIPGAAEVQQVRAEEGRQNQLPEEGRHRALLVHGEAAGRDGLRHQRADG